MNAPTLNDRCMDELRKGLEHVAGDLRQRQADLEAKAGQRWGGALSGRGPAAQFAAEVMAEAAQVVEARLAELPAAPRPEQRDTRKGTTPPVHPAHPDAQQGKPKVRG